MTHRDHSHHYLGKGRLEFMLRGIPVFLGPGKFRFRGRGFHENRRRLKRKKLRRKLRIGYYKRLFMAHALNPGACSASDFATGLY